MMEIFEIAIMQLKLTFQSKSSIFFYLLMPLIFTFLFSLTGSEPNRILLYVADQDKSAFSRELVSMVKDTGLYDIQESTEEEINELVVGEDGVRFGFIIPDGFGLRIDRNDTPSLKVISMAETSLAGTEYVFLSAISKLQQAVIIADMNSKVLSSYTTIAEISRWREESIADFLSSLKAPIVETRFTYADKSIAVNTTGNQSSSGFLAFFLCYAMILGAGGLLIEKENGTLKRLLTVSITKNQILVGKFIGNFILGLIQIFLLVTFGSIVIKVNWLLHPFWISILLLAYLFSLVSIGMLLSGLVKTHSQLNAIGILLIVGTGMLGGTWWPIELAPVWMQQFAVIVPQSWFMKAAIGLLGNSYSVMSVLTSVGFLLAMGILSIAISSKLVNIKKLLD